MIKLTQLLLIGLLCNLSLLAQDPSEIIQKSLDKVNGKSSQGEMEMTIVRPRYTRTMTMKSWSLGNGYFLIYITAPARDKGQVFLKRQTDMWNWIPNISRMIKLPPSMMGQNWMGSDFTNDDLVKMNSLAEDYTHKLLGEEQVDGLECYKIELVPKPNSSVVWGKINLWIAKEEYYQMKGEYFDEDFELINTMEASEITQFDDRKLPARLVMTPLNKPGNQTIMVNKNLKFSTDLQEDFFSQQNMKRVR
ncbi:MAG: outer membrane lipoprotein-sorting protein [Reichenbachiella sp.]|uniref:outer membrane lipoprotein-sorting protein n=1 Tax=Reichenbachiella sp. TaxID=2184521 RepID=UPI003266395B